MQCCCQEPFSAGKENLRDAMHVWSLSGAKKSFLCKRTSQLPLQFTGSVHTDGSLGPSSGSLRSNLHLRLCNIFLNGSAFLAFKAPLQRNICHFLEQEYVNMGRRGCSTEHLSVGVGGRGVRWAQSGLQIESTLWSLGIWRSAT